MASVGSDQFAMKLAYDELEPALGGGHPSTTATSPSSDGGRPGSAIKYKEQWAYVFDYDACNRLTEADWAQWSTYDVGVVQPVTYDANGNLTRLLRKDDANQGTALDYTYAAGANRLATVAGSTDPADFTQTGTLTYTYDANGNVTQGRGVDQLTYDGRNLPLTMPQGALRHTLRYDASGQRIYRRLLDDTTAVSTEYYVRGAAGEVPGGDGRASAGLPHTAGGRAGEGELHRPRTR